MARNRLRKNERTYLSLALFGLFAFGLLIWLLSQIVWNSVAGALLALVAATLAIYAIVHFFRIARFKYLKARRLEMVSHIKSTVQMTHLSPTDFEHYVAALYENLGYSAKVTPQSNDGGIDVILKDKNGSATGIQVKRYKSDSKVSRPDIQRLVGACANKYEKMIFVTSSDFSAEAISYAAEQGVTLVNGGSLEAMVKKISDKDPLQESFVFKLHRRMLIR